MDVSGSMKSAFALDRSKDASVERVHAIITTTLKIVKSEVNHHNRSDKIFVSAFGLNVRIARARPSLLQGLLMWWLEIERVGEDIVDTCDLIALLTLIAGPEKLRGLEPHDALIQLAIDHGAAHAARWIREYLNKEEARDLYRVLCFDEDLVPGMIQKIPPVSVSSAVVSGVGNYLPRGRSVEEFAIHRSEAYCYAQELVSRKDEIIERKLKSIEHSSPESVWRVSQLLDDLNLREDSDLNLREVNDSHRNFRDLNLRDDSHLNFRDRNLRDDDSHLNFRDLNLRDGSHLNFRDRNLRDDDSHLNFRDLNLREDSHLNFRDRNLRDDDSHLNFRDLNLRHDSHGNCRDDYSGPSSSNSSSLHSQIKELIDPIRPYIFGRTPMCKAIRSASQLFELSRAKSKVFFILSDGNSTDGNPLDLVGVLQDSNVIRVSCYLTDEHISNQRCLIDKAPSDWPKSDGRHTLFDMSSTVRNIDPPVSFLLDLDDGWTLPPSGESRLFVQANSLDVVDELCKVVVAQLTNPCDGLVDLIGKVPLGQYINQENASFKPEMQDGKTCFANAIATVFHLAMKRIVGRDDCLDPERIVGRDDCLDPERIVGRDDCLDSEQIVGQDDCLDSERFTKIKKRLIDEYDKVKNKPSTREILEKFCPEYRFHFKKSMRFMPDKHSTTGGLLLQFFC